MDITLYDAQRKNQAEHETTEWKEAHYANWRSNECFAHNLENFFKNNNNKNNIAKKTKYFFSFICRLFEWLVECWEIFSNKYKVRQTSFVERLHIVYECSFYECVRERARMIEIDFGRGLWWILFEISPKKILNHKSSS